MSMIYFNRFESPKGIMIAMCDEELMGRMLSEGRIEIDLEHYGGFYKGELLAEDEAARRIDRKVYSANIVGNRSVDILVRMGIVKGDEVKTVQGVKFVHIFRVDK